MLDQTSLAPAVGVTAKNVQFAPDAQNLPRKILIIGTSLPAAMLAPHQVIRVLSPEHVGSIAGFGSMLHRLAIQTFRGGMGVETCILPQDETGAAAVGSIDFTNSNNVSAGTLYPRIAFDEVAVQVVAGATPAQLAAAVVAAVNKVKAFPVIAAVDVEVQGKVNFTAKNKGVWGNDITLRINMRAGQIVPNGVNYVITAMQGGAGVPDMAAALNALGVGDGANEDGFTDVVHGYGLDTTTLDAISAYVGEGNDAVGLYAKTVRRPFRALTGDTAAGENGLNDLITLADTRTLDRANGVLPVPSSAGHPSELAAQAIGHMARINNDRVAQHYLGIPLIGVDPGVSADRWTDQYDNRDIAVKNGISATRVQAGVVTLQSVVSFYRPVDVPVTSNGFRSMRNIAIIQNMLENVRVTFAQEKWQGISIAANVARVGSAIDREKVRDIDSVIDELVALAVAFERKGWIYEAAYTINRLKQPGVVTIRPGGNGFDCILPVILSGEGGILDTRIEFDTSLAVLLN